MDPGPVACSARNCEVSALSKSVSTLGICAERFRLTFNTRLSGGHPKASTRGLVVSTLSSTNQHVVDDEDTDDAAMASVYQGIAGSYLRVL